MISRYTKMKSWGDNTMIYMKCTRRRIRRNLKVRKTLSIMYKCWRTIAMNLTVITSMKKSPGFTMSWSLTKTLTNLLIGCKTKNWSMKIWILRKKNITINMSWDILTRAAKKMTLAAAQESCFVAALELPRRKFKRLRMKNLTLIRTKVTRKNKSYDLLTRVARKMTQSISLKNLAPYFRALNSRMARSLPPFAVPTQGFSRLRSLCSRE